MSLGRICARLAAVFVIAIFNSLVLAAPASADDPGTQTIIVARGGQTL
jgi:hypothetical protein